MRPNTTSQRTGRLDIRRALAKQLALEPWRINNALELFDGGGTVPFVARYRKEQTGGMDEIQLRSLLERHQYLTELEDRKDVILQSIEEQGKLTDDLLRRIESAAQKAELEDLYLPFRPKRRTRATAARERGLEPLAEWIQKQNESITTGVDLLAEAGGYVDADREVPTPEDALQGASDILAEGVAETANYRARIRRYLLKQGVFTSQIKGRYKKGTTQFETYRDFRVPVKDVAAHQLLALLRGEDEGILTVKLSFDEERVLAYLADREVRTPDPTLRGFLTTMVADAFGRLMKNTLVGDVRQQKKQEADAASVATFAANLRELLLAAPAGMRPTLGIDPGYRTGCKLAVLDETGKFLEHATIFPHGSEVRQEDASRALSELAARHDIELVAVGNGTAGRETEQFASKVLSEGGDTPVCVLVSEAGASVYSASEVAIDEFPDLDVTVRGAISIGRRLQDPLAELVKIDPRSIGVGQYQHDVDQNLLQRKLEETVESCVNYVGVDLNMASRELL
ncbi:MAG: Tex-like N-terminal domain-containing protein, partial [Rhodothermales bacterium]